MTTPSGESSILDEAVQAPYKITLHAAGIGIQESAVYFTFPTGRWTFDCVSCGAQCCRGHGYSLSAGQDATKHWDGAEALRLFASPADKANLMVSNFKPACYKLTDSGLCQVHMEHGFAAKPETCRLFPFNGLKILGSYLVVEPHSHLCPLALASVPSPLSDHSSLLAVMRAQGIHRLVERAAAPDHRLDAVINVEKAIRDLASGCDETVETYAAQQVLLTASALRLPTPANLMEARATVDDFGPHLRRLLGCWPAPAQEADREVAAIVRAVTPTLRSQLLFPTVTSRRPILSLPMIRFPRLVVALHKLLALAAEAGMRRITYQTVMAVAQRYEFLLRFSVWADESMMWRASRGQVYRRRAESRDDYGRYVRAAKLLGTNNRSATLADVVGVACGEEPVGRLDRLERLCRRLSTAVVPRSQAVGMRRPSFGGWLLRNASEDVLWKFAAARARVKYQKGA